MNSGHKLILLLSFVLILMGCGNDKITTYYPSGEKYEVYEYKGDSLKHGPYLAYDEQGGLLEKSHYSEGKLDGVRELYSNDTLQIREHYTKDVITGPYEVFYPDGILKMEAQFNQGKLEGIVKSYYPGGALKEEVTFENNMENGPFTEYHPNGEVMWKGSYLNGDNEFGLLQQFNEEGVLIKKMMCNEDAVCTTTWTIEDGDKTQ